MLHSEIGHVTWRSSPVVREFGKANSYWLMCVCGREDTEPPLSALTWPRDCGATRLDGPS